MTPDLLSEASENPRAVADALLAEFDADEGRRLVDELHGVVSDNPLARHVARSIQLQTHPLHRRRQADVAKELAVTRQSVNQRVIAQQAALDHFTSRLRTTRTVAYLEAIIGRVCAVTTLPSWVRGLLLGPTPTGPWGSPADLALSLARAALHDRELVADDLDPPQWWVVPEGSTLTETLDALADILAPSTSVVRTADETRTLLTAHGVVPRHVEVVLDQMVLDHNLLRFDEQVVCFAHTERVSVVGDRTRRRGSTEARIRVLHRLLPDLDDEHLVRELTEQHRLARGSVENALRASRG